MNNRWKTWLLTGLCGLLATGIAQAGDPLEIELKTLEDFELAWQEGDIVPVLDWTESEALEGLHPGQGDLFRPPQLYVVDELVDPETGELLDSEPGLVMAWGAPEDTGEIISAWDYVLPEDPDLTGLCITLTAFPWNGMTSISFSLRDVNNVMKGWRWPVGPNGLPPQVATTLTVAASGGPGQAGSWVYWDGGVDLTQIVAFEFDEGGIAQGGIPLPPGAPPGLVGSWNFWRNIFVHPCPPPPREHFTCYKVDELTTLRGPVVSLADQFVTEDGVVVGKAREICLPVDKNGEGIFDPEYHLVCYQIFARQRVDLDVAVSNQLGDQELRVKGKVERLCVPSTKTVLE